MRDIPVHSLTSEDDIVTREIGPECYAQLKVRFRSMSDLNATV
jgi:hypothetical protein